ncbi:MAG: ABC transporter ATP-binding protein [Chloroflexi bacterium]|nr:ABC transporter ATP-binding protein [Chloroflexota bacterium]
MLEGDTVGGATVTKVPSDGPAIEVTDLKKRYGQVQAVDGISFSVSRGEVFGMLGPNGAGKTTTVEIVEGLRRPDSGHVAVLGYDVSRQPRAVKERIGVQLQTPTLLPRLTAYEILELFGSFFPNPRPPGDLITLLGLEEVRDRRAGTLSGGQAQRLSIGLALVNDPAIVFLDEPTTGLDPQARVNLWELVEAISAGGATVLLTTHYMEEAERLCDRVAIVDHGRIVALDAPRGLIDANFSETAIIFRMPGPPREDLERLSGVREAQIDEDEVTLYSADVPATMAALLDLARGREHALQNLYVRGATLEDVFLKLTGRRLRE